MSRTGKIARLPRAIRDQLNLRLDDNEPFEPILEWLNSLPETQAVLAEHFEGKPISQQNLTEWKAGGFRDWQAQQAALQFAEDLDSEDAELQPLLASPLSDKLARWIALRYAAAARNLANTETQDPETELRRLRAFCLDIVALRRGDHSAGRLKVEQERLALLLADTDQEREKEFWEWTKRPDIQAKLYPHRDPDKIRQDVVKMLDHRLLGVRHRASAPNAQDPDPACLI